MMFFLKYQKNLNLADLMHCLKCYTVLGVNVANISGYLACQSAHEVIETQNCVQFTFFFSIFQLSA